GFAPAATVRTPSLMIACASTVAVVVPSPATSLVLDATSRTIWAPMFSTVSLSSISLATVTPSLVIVGLPNFLSMTTLRPLGPSVAFTASAMMLTPLSRALRASSSNLSCFGMSRVPPYSRMARTSSSRRMRYSLSSILTSEPEYFPKRILSPAFTSRDLLALVGDLPVAHGDHLRLLRLLLGGVGNDDPAPFDLLLLEPLDEDAVMQRTNLHGVSASSSVLC